MTPQLQFDFVETFGGDDVEGGHFGAGSAVTTDSMGNAYVLGYRDSQIHGDGRGEDLDAFVRKYSPSGSLVWSTSLRTDVGTEGGAIHYLHDVDRAIAVDSNGNVYVTALLSGTVQFGESSLTSAGGVQSDVIIAKLDSTGQLDKLVQIGDVLPDSIHGIATGTDDTLVVTGMFGGTVAFGSTTLTSDGFLNAFVARLDTQLNVLKATSIDIGTGTVIGPGVDSSNNIYIAGSFGLGFRPADPGSPELVSTGSLDIFVAKLDSNLRVTNAVSMGGGYMDIPTGMAVDRGGNVFVTGRFHLGNFYNVGTAQFGSIVLSTIPNHAGGSFVARLDSTLNVTNAIRVGGHEGSASNPEAGLVEQLTIATDQFGNAYLTGIFYETADFGGTSLTARGTRGLLHDADAFVAQMDGSLNILDAVQMGAIGDIDFGNAISTDRFGNVYATGYLGAVSPAEPANFGQLSVTATDNHGFLVKLKSALSLSDRIRQLDTIAFDGVGNDISLQLTGAASDQPADIYVGQTLTDLRYVGTFANAGGSSDWRIDFDIHGSRLKYANLVAVVAGGNLRIVSATSLHPLFENLTGINLTPATLRDPPQANTATFEDVAKLYRWNGNSFVKIPAGTWATDTNIDWTKKTVILTHGWDSSLNQPGFVTPFPKVFAGYLSNEDLLTYNVLAIDWYNAGSGEDASKGANPNGIDDSNHPRPASIPDAITSLNNGKVAAAVFGNKLVDSLRKAQIPVDPAKLILIGHSNGSGFMASLAKTLFVRTGIKTKELVALDAPAIVPRTLHEVQSAAPYVSHIDNYFIASGQRFLVFGDLDFGVSAFGGPLYETNVTNYNFDVSITQAEVASLIAALNQTERPGSLHSMIPLRYDQTVGQQTASPPWGFRSSYFVTNQPRDEREGTWVEVSEHPGSFKFVAKLPIEFEEVLDSLIDSSKQIGQMIAVTRTSIWDASIQVSQDISDWLKGVNSALATFTNSSSLRSFSLDAQNAESQPIIYSKAHSPVLSSIDVRVPADADLLSFDLSVSDFGNNDQLFVTFGNEIIGQIDLATVQLDGSQHFEYWVGAFAGSTATLNFYMPSQEASTAEYLISNAEFVTLNRPPILPSLPVQAISAGHDIVIDLTAVDPESGEVTYRLEDGAPFGSHIDPFTGRFTWSVSGNQPIASYTITVLATDDGPGALSTRQTFIINVADFILSNQSVPEMEPNVVVGTLAINDSDVDNTYTFSILSGSDAAQFVIQGNQLAIGPIGLDFESGATRTVTIRATDQNNSILDKAFTIQLSDVNEKPTLSLPIGSAVDFVKGTTSIPVLAQINAGDPDASGIRGGELQVCWDEIRSKKKRLDQLNLPSASSIGVASSETLANGRTVRTFQLGSNVTNIAVQDFLRGIRFSTSGKGLKTATREIRVVLTDSEGLSTSVSQTIRVFRRKPR